MQIFLVSRTLVITNSKMSTNLPNEQNNTKKDDDQGTVSKFIIHVR